MALKGDLASFSLSEIFQSIRVNQQSGTLEVSDGEQFRSVYFTDGTITLPQPTDDLQAVGEILLRRDKISEEDLAAARAAVEERSDGTLVEVLRRGDAVRDKDLRAVQREAIEEEIYDLFLWEDAYFEFRKDELPEDLADERVAFPTDSILMEAALRVDEWERITEVIPSMRFIFRVVGEPGSLPEEMPVPFERIRPLLDGARPVRELAHELGASTFDVCKAIHLLVEAGAVEARPIDEVEIAFQDALRAEDFRRAIAYFEYALELGPSTRRVRDRMMTALLSDQTFIEDGERRRIVGQVDRIDFTRFFLTLVLKPHRGVLRMRDRSGERVVYVSPDELRVGSFGERKQPPIGNYLVKRREATRLEVDRALTIQREEPERRIDDILVDLGATSARKIEEAVRAQVLEQIFDSFLWRGARFEFAKNAPPPSEEGLATLDLSDADSRREVVRNLDRFGDIMETISSSKAIFVADDPALAGEHPDGEDERGVLALVDGRRTVQEILRAGEGSPIDIAEFLYFLANRQVIRTLTPAEMRSAVDRAIRRSDLSTCVRICEYALEEGVDPAWFEGKLEEIKLKNPDFLQTTREYKLEGDIKTFGLAELFQSLHLNKHSGTLEVTDGRRERLIYFSEGTIYLLSRGVQEVSRIGDLLLDSGKIEEDDLKRALALQETQEEHRRLGEVLVQMGVVSMAEILSTVKDKIREELFDVFLWENARFEFTKNYLPDVFFGTEGPVTKMEMDTGEILLEAMQRLQEWEEIESVLGTDKTILRPGRGPEDDGDEASGLDELDPAARRIHGLLDGRRTIEEVVHDSGLGKLQTSRILRDLVESGFARPLAREELAELAEEAYQERDFELCVKYYEYGTLLDQEVEAELKRFVDLALGEEKPEHRGLGKRVVFKGGMDTVETFRRIAEERLSGTLHATDGASERTIYVNPELVVSRARGERGAPLLGEILIDMGLCQPSAVDRALELQEASGKKLGEILREEGILTAPGLKASLRAQAFRILIDLTRWQGAAIRFEANQVPDDLASDESVLRAELNLADLLEDVIEEKAAWDKVQRLIPSGDVILRAVRPDSWLNVAASHRTSPFLPLLDGSRTVEEVVAEGPEMKRIDAWRMLYGMVRDGVARPLEREAAMVRVTKARLTGHVERARLLLEHVVALDPHDEEARERLEALGSEEETADLTSSAREVLGALREAYRTGTVVCEGPGDTRRLAYLDDDALLLTGDGVDVAPRLGDVLVREGRASREKVEAAADFQERARESRRIGEILTLQGVCGNQSIEEALREQGVIGLRRFLEMEGEARFRAGERAEAFDAPDADVLWYRGDPRPLLEEADDRLGGWRAIDEAGVTDGVIVTVDPDGDRTPPRDDPVLPLIDGTRRVEELVEASDLGRYEVLRGVARLIEIGVVTPLDVSEARQAAQTAYAEGDLPRSERLFAYVVQRDPDDERSARFLERIRRTLER